MATTADGNGVWLVGSDGGVFAFGTAKFVGSAGGLPLQRPIVGMAAAPDGNGYWLVASDGGVFAYGSAPFVGSAGGLPLQRPIVGMAAAPDGNGYWLVGSDGGIFNYGSARFAGSAGSLTLRRPIVGMAATADGTGYWLVASDGGIFGYGTAAFAGSAADGLGTSRSAAAIVRSAGGRGYLVLGVPAGVRVGFAGDVHGVGRVATLLASGGNPLDGMRPVLNGNDLNVVNLETAVGSQGRAQVKQFTFHSPPVLTNRLREAGVTVVNLANNHSLDFGAGALLETIDHARAAGLLVVGAGANAAAAFTPAIVTTPGGTVAVFGFSQVVPPGWAAAADRPGVASAYDLRAATNAIRAARATADHVVVMIHAGVELAPCPSGLQRSLVRALIEAGADVVAGGHPHLLQGVETIGAAVVDYSLGNFVWYHSEPPTDRTGMFSVDLGPTGVQGYDFTPAVIDGSGSPQPLSGQAAADVRGYVDAVSPGHGRC